MLTVVRDVELKAEKAAVQYLISIDYEGDIAALATYSTEQLVLRLSKFIYTSDEVAIEVPVPISAWEHLKKQYAPAWFISKWPVKNKSVTIKAKEVFPHLSFISNNRARNLHCRIYEPIEAVPSGT